MNYSGYTLYETASYAPDTGSVISTEVLNNNSELKIGKSACNLGLGMFNSKSGKLNQLSIGFNNLRNNGQYLEADEISKALSQESYIAAVKIVQSLHQEK